MNTRLFNRHGKGLNPLLRLFQRSHQPFSRFKKESAVETPPDLPARDTAGQSTVAAVRLSPGTYRLREENTTFTDRQSALRFVVARCLGISIDLVNDQTVLSGAGLSRQSLLDLIAATDLEFGVYVEPELFGPDFTFSRLSDLVFKTGVKDRDHDEE